MPLESVDTRTLIQSSLRRSGPISLFSEYEADFIIVKSSKSKECLIWKEWLYFNDVDIFRGEIAKIHDLDRQYSARAVDPYKFDWSVYDIVICIDITVPSRIVKRYPNTLWCYYLQEPCLSFKYAETFGPMFGYNVFIDQMLVMERIPAERLARYTEWPRMSIHFPQFLQNGEAIKKLYPDEDEPKSGIYIESRSYRQRGEEDVQALSKFGPVRGGYSEIEMIMRNLCRSKYLVVLPNRRTVRYRGQSLVEGISAGCLVLSPQRDILYRDLLTPGTIVSTFDELMDRIEYFEKNPDAYDKERQLQKSRVDEYCFNIPMQNLLSVLEAHKKRKVPILSVMCLWLKEKLEYWLVFRINHMINYPLMMYSRKIFRKIFRQDIEIIVARILSWRYDRIKDRAEKAKYSGDATRPVS